MGFVKQIVNIIFNKTKKDNSRGKLTFNGSKRILHNDQGQVNCPESGASKLPIRASFLDSTEIPSAILFNCLKSARCGAFEFSDR